MRIHRLDLSFYLVPTLPSLALILSSRLHKDWKTFKIQTRSKQLMSGKEWDCLEKNYRLKRNKKLLMILLNVVEAIVSFQLSV